MVNAMSGAHYINENQSDIRGIKPGWYMADNDGNLSSGPFLSQEECHGRDAQPNISRPGKFDGHTA
jgi:hypothetical protein